MKHSADVRVFTSAGILLSVPELSDMDLVMALRDPFMWQSIYVSHLQTRQKAMREAVVNEISVRLARMKS